MLLLFGAVFFRTTAGRISSAYIGLKIPIRRKNINCNIIQALNLLLASGLTAAESLAICGEVIENPVVQNDLKKISIQVSQGASLCESLEKLTYINNIFTSLVRIGENTGNLPLSVAQCNSYFQAEYKHAIRRLNKLIEPIITIILGIILAVIMIAIILPTFELATTI